jgi:hypothetical protein
VNYGEVIVLSAKLVWRHKHLWALGLMVALLSGNCGGGGSSFNFTGTGGPGTDEGDFSGPLPEPWASWLETDPAVLFGAFLALVAGILVLGLIWFLAWLIIRPVARGGLAYSVDRLTGDQPSGFGIAWAGGWRRKGSLIGISLLLELLPGLILVLLILGLVAWILAPVIAAGGAFEDSLGPLFAVSLTSGIVALCCLIPLGILVIAVLGVLTELSSIAAVLERRSAGSAIGRAWRLMRERPGPLALIWLITVAVGMLLGTIAAMPILAVVFLFLLPLQVAGDPPLALWALAGFFLVLAGLFAFAITSWLMAYSTSLWTLTFRSLTGGAPERALTDTA